MDMADEGMAAVVAGAVAAVDEAVTMTDAGYVFFVHLVL